MTIERWKTFSKRDQLLFIGSEFERARVSERDNEPEYLRGALERAIVLIDLTERDEKWHPDLPMLEGLKNTISTFLDDPARRGVAMLYEAL